MGIRNAEFGMRNGSGRPAKRRCPRLRTPHSALRTPNSTFRNPQSAIRNRPRSGFTLLEVLLAIAITLLTMSLVGGAVYSQLRIMEQIRIDTQQAQVARALLRHIGDDLRNVIKYAPIEVSIPTGAAGGMGTGSMGGSGAPTGGSGDMGMGGTGQTGMGQTGTPGGASGGQSGGQGGSGTGGTGQGGGSSAGSGTTGGSQTSSGNSSTTGESTGAMPAESSSFNPDAIPGVRGFADFIKIDISRLPRRDQLLAAEQGLGTGGRATDVKTIAYFVDDPSTTQDGTVGLKRYEIARAESLMSVETGEEEQLMRTNSKLLADEVVRIRFEYTDGSGQWYEVWPPAEPQSETEAALLPLAVHVVLYLKPPGFDNEFAGQAWSGLDMTGFPQRRLIVPLPAAELPDESATSSSSDSSSSDSNSSNSSTNSSTTPTTPTTPSTGTGGTGGTGGSGGTPGGSGGGGGASKKR